MSSIQRSTWWIVTDFDEQRFDQYFPEDKSQYPMWIEAVHGGVEICSTTGKRHMQAAIQCRSQQRMSTLMKWAPGAHLEPAKSKDAVKAYCMKEETAEGEKKSAVSSVPYAAVQSIISELAEHVVDMEFEVGDGDNTPRFRTANQWDALDPKVKIAMFVAAANQILYEQTDRLTHFANPRLKTLWVDHGKVYVGKAIMAYLDKLAMVDDPELGFIYR